MAATAKSPEVPTSNAVHPSQTYGNGEGIRTITLRPYQDECIQSCIEALDKPDTSRIGVSSPTGSGKTTIFCTLIARMDPPSDRPQATRAMILVGSIELARQAAAQMGTLFPHLSVEIEQGQKHEASGLADVTVATYQTLKREERLSKFDPQDFKVIIVDEAHHAVAPSYLKILSYFNSGVRTSAKLSEPSTSNTSQSQVPIVGFSATFSRHDGTALGKVFQEIVHHQNFLEMINEKWLCDVVFTTVRAKLDLSGVLLNNATGDFQPTSLAQVVNTEAINRLVVRTWLERALDRRSTLIFCVNIAHVKDLTAVFREAGIDARYMTGSTPATERKELLDDFRAQKFPILINCAILTEGADVPNIDCVIVARPTRSTNLFAQIIGRGLRLSPKTGKQDCRIIDFVDSLARVGNIVSGPTLLGLEEDEIVEDDSLDADALPNEALSRRPPFAVPDPEVITFEDHDNPFSLVNNAAGSPMIRSMSPYAWVQCGADTWVLDCLGKGFIKVQSGSTGEKARASASEPDHFVATFTPAATPGPENASRPPFFRKRQILTAPGLREAVRACDTYATKKILFGRMSFGLFRSARWRQTPATDKQKAMLKSRMRSTEHTEFHFSTEAGTSRRPTSLDTLTKGQAANIINRLNHGAQAYYEKQVRTSTRQQQKMIAAKRKREGHVVGVGPLPQVPSI